MSLLLVLSACGDSTTTPTPVADVPPTNDVPATDTTPGEDVQPSEDRESPQDRLVPPDLGDPPVDVPAPDDVPPSKDVPQPPPDLIIEDTPPAPDVPPVEDVPVPPPDVPPAMDVPVPPPDVPPAMDVPTPPRDVPIGVDNPPPPPDVPVDTGPVCPNGIVDTCPTSGTGGCPDLNTGAARTVSFRNLTTGLPASCEGTQTSMGPDGVLPLTLSAASDVVITGTPTGGAAVALTLHPATGCGNRMAELQCSNSSTVMGGVATLRAQSLAAGTYWVTASSSNGAAAILQAMITPARPRLTGDVCPGVSVTPDGAPATVNTMGFTNTADYGTTCGAGAMGSAGVTDAVFTFRTTAARDVTVDVSATGTGQVAMELTTTCGSRMSAVPMCVTGNPARRTFRNLPAGTYYLTVDSSSTAARSVVATVTTANPTLPNPADQCPGVALTDGTVATANLAQLTAGSAMFTCHANVTADGVFSFRAPPAGNDVLVNVTTPMGSTAGLLVQRPCGGATVGACVGRGTNAGTNNVWQRYRGLTAGETYSLVAGSTTNMGNVTARYLAVPTALAQTVTTNTTCANARTVPNNQTLFTGTTAAAGGAPMAAPCGGVACAGGRRAYYRFDLMTRRRVVLHTVGSSFDTVVAIQSGTTCPGTPVTNACNDDAIGTASLVDVTLNPGTYWILVAGCGLNVGGNYTLDVAVINP
jgi:hypothetical protein